MTKSPFRYFKTSSVIIQLAVMMYVRYPLSLYRGPATRARHRYLPRKCSLLVKSVWSFLRSQSLEAKDVISRLDWLSSKDTKLALRSSQRSVDEIVNSQRRWYIT